MILSGLDSLEEKSRESSQLKGEGGVFDVFGFIQSVKLMEQEEAVGQRAAFSSRKFS